MWKTVKLSDICKLNNGRAYKKPELLPEGKYPVLRVGNFFTSNRWYYSDLELDDTKYCDTGDLLYAWSASFGPRIWEGDKVIYHYHIWRVDIDETLINKRFLFYWFEFDKELIKAASGTGTTMMHVSMGSMNKRELALPPLAEQQRIVTKLDAAFAEIDAAIATAKKNAESAKNIFSTFLSDIFKAEKENYFSGVIEEFCTIKSGATVKKSIEKQVGDIPYLKVADMNLEDNVNEVLTSTRFLNKEDVKKNGIIEAGATIFPKRGGAIMTNKKRITSVPICADLNIMSVRPNDSLHPKLLYYYFLNIDMRKLGSGSSIPQINNYDIHPLPISFPKKLSEQNEMISKSDNLLKVTNHLNEVYKCKIKELGALKASLLLNELTSEAA